MKYYVISQEMKIVSWDFPLEDRTLMSVPELVGDCYFQN